MSRIPRESLFGGGHTPAGTRHKVSVNSMEADESLDLFSRRRRTHLISSHAEPNGHSETAKLESITVGSGKLRSGLDDLLSSELGKHDYDWLLTPPGTPLFSSLDASEPQVTTTTTAAPKNKSNVRSVSTTKASRLSVSQTENGHSTRPARSISAMRPSISATHSSSNFSNNNRTSILNTSSASVTSRPSTPGNRSSSTTISSARTSTPTSRTVPSRSSTPARTRPSTPTRTRPTPSSSGDKPKPAYSSRPSTPTARPQIPSNSNSNSSIPSPISRSSTPTRRVPAATTTARSPSAGRAAAVNRPASPSMVRPSMTTSRPLSRPSSPAPRARAPVHPINLPDFPLDVPPNLRTKLPERPASAGRTRPGMALTVRATTNTDPAPVSSNRRSSLPIATKGRFPENSLKGRLHGNGNEGTPAVAHAQKSTALEAASRRTAKPASTPESSGFGRTISKSSLDMALRHMDIRQNIGSIRGTSLFPHSIRSSPKGRTVQTGDLKVPTVGVRANMNGNGHIIAESYNGAILENGDNMLKSPDRESFMTRANEPDPYGSYRYDAILLKEDSKNMNWLHSVEDKSDQSPEFDHRFEPLPEPFAPL